MNSFCIWDAWYSKKKALVKADNQGFTPRNEQCEQLNIMNTISHSLLRSEFTHSPQRIFRHVLSHLKMCTEILTGTDMTSAHCALEGHVCSHTRLSGKKNRYEIVSERLHWCLLFVVVGHGIGIMAPIPLLFLPISFIFPPNSSLLGAKKNIPL